MKISRFLSLLFALSLQVVPLVRPLLPALLPRLPAFAFVFRVAAVVAGVRGALHAVSAASTVITSPKTATGTNGVPFGYRITTGPDSANRWSTGPLPPGLKLNTSLGVISGVPTQSGLYNTTITASDNNRPDRTITANLAIAILSLDGPPGLAGPIGHAVAKYGQGATLTIPATGTAPLTFDWRQNGRPVPEATGNTLKLTATRAADYGDYTVTVSNALGSTNVTVSLLYPAPLVAKKSAWRYLDTGVTPAANWRTAAFNDGAWKSGAAQLGYGDGDEATVVSFGGNGSAKFITTWFRTTLNLPADPAVYRGLQLNLLRDDGAAVYLNGVELRRDNLPAGALTATTVASTTVDAADEAAYLSTQAAATALVPGPNVVAVEVHQASASSSDLSFDLEVVGLTAGGPPVIETQPVAQAAKAGTAVTFTATAAGLAPLTVRWRHNDDDLPDQRAETLVLTNLSAAQAGTYQAIFTNALGDAISDPVNLTVLPVSNPGPPNLSLTAQSGGLALQFQAEGGFAYLIEETPDLTQPWTPLTELPAGTGGPVSLSVDGDASTRFLRVRINPGPP